EGEVGAFILIHGGGWSAGDKENQASQAKEMTQKGYVAAAINYRMFPQGAGYVEMLEDIGLAIAKLKEMTLADGISVSRVALIGGSAGGHLSLLYAYMHLNGTQNAPAIPVGFAVGRCAPVDFFDSYYTASPTDDMVNSISDLIGTPLTAENFEENRTLIESASPLYMATADAPPTILCYGGQDVTVPISNGLSMKAKLEELNVTHSWFYYENSGHGLSGSLDPEVHAQYKNTLWEYAELYF
ncbi:MAG: alpha/beta hydrolase, partial [Oscillospiraceae bacterium]|nr:alpha/beta hydrolase [Oscillospiraceae bacterium]